MRILKCHITNFGRYSDQTFDFSKNLNPFFLKNGEGKTTLATFLKAMFYSLEKSGKTSYERKHYKPYSGGEYGGSLEIKLDKTIYRIERTFADSPSKDSLKIYDENGVIQTKFLNKEISSLQGEASSLLGELIFGINALAFQKCNFISSSDLDFSNNESIKMKIGNIVIDKEKENSYKETYDSIVDCDLRDKKPTALKKENAYPYKIKELEKKNKEKKAEIQELNQLESSLQNLYLEQDKIKKELNQIEEKQKDFSKMHVLKGKMSMVETFNKDIQEKNDYINNINVKYNEKIPSSTILNSLKENIDNLNKYEAIDESINISSSNIEKLNLLENNVISDDDYSSLLEANNKIIQTQNEFGIVKIDLERYKILKSKFDGKTKKDDIILEKEYFDYLKSTSIQDKNFENVFDIPSKDYPSEIVLTQIDNEIKEYNDLKKKDDEIKSSYKENSTLLKILLIIITLGIYLIFLKKKKNEFKEKVARSEKLLEQKENDLNAFFNKYDKQNGSFEFKMVELKDDILKYEKSKEDNVLKNEKRNLLISELEEKKRDLLSYFSLFGYSLLDVEKAYNLYKKDLQEYNDFVKDEKRNNEINDNIQKIKEEQINKIDEILAKYSLKRRDDFSSQLNEINENISFYKKYNPLYINKKENDEKIKKYESKIEDILLEFNIDFVNQDSILSAKKVIEEIEKYNDEKEARINLIEKKNQFIKENNLSGFVVEDIEVNEENLRKEHELKTLELTNKEDEINQIETNILKRDSLNDEINENLDLIEEYKQKIKIAKIAAEILKKAEDEMEAKFIGPIKDSFITYANQMYEKIGSNVNMDYDYEIKYDVQGHLRDAKDLSDGERTIMMLSLRFSVLDSLYKNHDSIIVLDDPFESLDDEKLNKAKELIKSLSSKWQIIYFTCHESRKIL